VVQVTGTPIPPIVPRNMTTAAAPAQATGQMAPRTRRPLPLAALGSRPTPSVVYRIAALDRCGHLAERSVKRALGWTPEQRLDIQETAGLLVIHADPDGAFRTTGQGHLRLPARVRRWCGLEVGDRVLLAADPTRDELLVCPPTVLDSMIADLQRRPERGECA
jgi:hypothetical protein